MIDRGEKIELLVDKAEELNEQAARFKKQSNTVRRPPRAHTHACARSHTCSAFGYRCATLCSADGLTARLRLCPRKTKQTAFPPFSVAAAEAQVLVEKLEDDGHTRLRHLCAHPSILATAL